MGPHIKGRPTVLMRSPGWMGSPVLMRSPGFDEIPWSHEILHSEISWCFKISCSDEISWYEISWCDEISHSDEIPWSEIPFRIRSPVLIRSPGVMRSPGGLGSPVLRRSPGVLRSPGLMRSPVLCSYRDKLRVQMLALTISLKFPGLTRCPNLNRFHDLKNVLRSGFIFPEIRIQEVSLHKLKCTSKMTRRKGNVKHANDRDNEFKSKHFQTLEDILPNFK